MNDLEDRTKRVIENMVATQPLTDGERVFVQTTERCVCDKPAMSQHQTRCHLCDGKGWLFGAWTFTASGGKRYEPPKPGMGRLGK